MSHYHRHHHDHHRHRQCPRHGGWIPMYSRRPWRWHPAGCPIGLLMDFIAGGCRFVDIDTRDHRCQKYFAGNYVMVNHLKKLRDATAVSAMRGLVAEEDPNDLNSVPAQAGTHRPQAGTHRPYTEGSRNLRRDSLWGRGHRERPTVLAGKGRSPNRANQRKHGPIARRPPGCISPIYPRYQSPRCYLG